MGKPLILIYVGLRNDQSVWTPEWSNIQKIITKILWILPSILTMRRCVIFSWVKCLHASSIPISGIYEWQQRHALFFPHTSRAVRAWGWWALAPQFLADHYDCDTFGPPELVPNWLVPLGKRSPTNSVPVDKWSQKFDPHGQKVPNQFGPPGEMIPRIFHLSRGTGCGDPEIGGLLDQGNLILGDHCPWGPNLIRTICPGGSILCWFFVQGDRKWWSRNPGIKWVRDQMRCSLI